MRAISCGKPSEQPLRTVSNHDDHRQKQNDIGEIGKKRRAECVDEANDEAADKSTDEAAGAAEDHDNEGERQHVGIESGIGRQDRSAENAAGSRKSGAEAKYGGEQRRNRN